MSNSDFSKVNQLTIKKNRSISPLWLFTLLAVILAGGLLYRSISEAGERIQIQFQNAQGIIPGRTAIRYQGLEVGMIKKITLSDDLKSIYAEAEIYPEATQILNQKTIFWVVKPNASLTSGISGLDTLVSGNYVAVHPGNSKTKATQFVAAEKAPHDAFDPDSLRVHLKSDDLGSLSIGSGVYYKKILVGEVYDYKLDQDERHVTVSVKIKSEFSDLVKKQSRFWNVSGIHADIGLSGVKLNVENLASVIAGGITFDSPINGEAAGKNETFSLYPSINQTERGVSITLNLPKNHGISNQNAPILYQGLEIGRLDGIEFTPDFNSTYANANINPSMAWLLTSGSKFILERPEVGLNGVKNIANLVVGNSLSVLPGKGETSHSFQVETTADLQANAPDTLKVTLVADNSWGVGVNTKIVYRGFDVGFIHSSTLKQDKVILEAVIAAEHKALVKNMSRFFILGGINAQIGTDGVNVSVPAFAQMVSPAISFTSDGKSDAKSSYTLYQSELQAQNAKGNSTGTKTLILVTDTLPSVSSGSPVMYKNFTVGKVEGFTLNKQQIEVKVQIDNQYYHLINKDTVFWNHSGIDVKAGLSGVEINTASLKSMLAGGISFGTMQGIENHAGKNWKLYKTLSDAKNFGVAIHLTATNIDGLSVGSHIRYQGITVGEVTALTPAFKTDSLRVDAMIYPAFAEQLARAGSYFWIAEPTLSLTKTENLDALFGAYILVAPGEGKFARNFKLNKTEQYPGGLTVILESESRNSISVGTPLLFRDFQVGSVTDVRLGKFADRVIITARISDEYKQLVRTNTVFWNQSGIDVSFGLTGAKVQAGTIDSIIRGGIAFATPEDPQLAKPATAKQHFLLHQTMKPEWSSWRTAIPNF